MWEHGATEGLQSPQAGPLEKEAESCLAVWAW